MPRRTEKHRQPRRFQPHSRYTPGLPWYTRATHESCIQDQPVTMCVKADMWTELGAASRCTCVHVKASLALS